MTDRGDAWEHPLDQLAFRPSEFLAYLADRGCPARTEAGKILVANASQLADEDREALMTHRAAILQHLQDAATACPGVCPGIGADGCHGCPVPLVKVPASVREIDPDGWPCGWACRDAPA